MSTYDNNFFEYLNSGATVSARQIIPQLTKALDISSVLDVGCGQGAWLAVWGEQGVDDLLGIDGNYVKRDQLLVAEEQFSAHDLSMEFQLGRRFDLVQSLEVAEHLPATSAAGFVASLTRHSDIVLFSAAPKGQGGDHHVNEQDYDYWRKLFGQHDFVAFDYIRSRVQSIEEIEPWYRYNTFLYINRSLLQGLTPDLVAARVPDDSPLADISPPLYKARKGIVRWLPVSVMTRLAKIKEQLVAARRAGR